MRPLKAIKSGALSGLLAGLAFGLIILLFSEPIIDQAIAYEEPQEEVVSRSAQKAVAFDGAVFWGAVLGPLFALVLSQFYQTIPGRTARVKAMVLAALSFTVYPLLPFLTISPLPPGFEPSMSFGEREFWFAVAIMCAVLGILGSFLIHGLVRNASKGVRGRAAAFTSSIAILAALWSAPILLVPGYEVTGSAPASLISAFFWTTLLSWASFWSVLGLTLGELLARGQGSPRASKPLGI